MCFPILGMNCAFRYNRLENYAWLYNQSCCTMATALKQLTACD